MRMNIPIVNKYIKDAKLPDIFKFMMGMTYEQFKYQNLAWTYQSFSRNYHILLGSSKINRDEIVDINEKIGRAHV